MKRYLPLFFGAAISFFGSAQTVNDFTLDLNNADALVNDGGVFFNDEATSGHGFNIPAGSQLHTIFAMSFWYGGVDINGQIKLSAQKYQNLQDQFKGPLSADGAASPPPSGTWTNALFPITKSEIIAHIANFANPGYVIPNNILNWPAHGDLSLNQDYYLAPFVDVNVNGIYEPNLGEYPCIRGDQAVYVIMNDKGGLHTASGGDPLGIEMHYLFYEFLAPSDISNTIFVNGKVINRGTQTLNDFKVSVFMDGDIGYAQDDYFGSDSTRNLMYFYNGDNFDETAGGTNGYGSAAPASGLISLSKDFESISGLFGAMPNTASQYWNLMNGNDVSGVPWANPTTGNPIRFWFASDPSSSVEIDSEQAYANPPGDRKGLATLDFGVLVPSSEHEFDYAFIYNRDSVSQVDNASGLRNVADIVQNFFDTTFVNDCDVHIVGIPEHGDVDFSIYPNPSSGQFTLSLGTDFSNAEIEMYDISGRSVIGRVELKSKESNIEVDQPAGIYLLHLTVDGHETVKRIILE